MPVSIVSLSKAGKSSSSLHAGLVGLLLVLLVLATMAVWLCYAYFFPHTWSGQVLIKVRYYYFFGEICLLTFVCLIAVPSDEVALAEERAQVHGRLHPHVIISMKASNKRERKRKIKFGAEILLRYTHTYIVRTYVGRKRQKIGLFPKKQSGRKNKENGGKTYMLQQEFRKT